MFCSNFFLKCSRFLFKKTDDYFSLSSRIDDAQSDKPKLHLSIAAFQNGAADVTQDKFQMCLIFFLSIDDS